VRRYRFVLSPGYLLLTVLVATSVVVMITLGFWQLRRLEGRRAANEVIAAKQVAPPAALADLLPPDAAPAEVDEAIWRTMTVSGEYVERDQVLIRNRTQGGAPGYWVITPLRQPEGRTVAVNRGWVPLSVESDPAAFRPPDGQVTVTGMVQGTQTQEGIGATDPEGRVATLSRVDLARLQRQVEHRIEPVWLQMQRQQPAQPKGPGSVAIPIPVPQEPLDEGPHLGYAGQWFVFAALTCVVYPLAIRRAARIREARALDETSDPEAAVADRTRDEPVTIA
jgi:surfeit locus 1 family protein